MPIQDLMSGAATAAAAVAQATTEKPRRTMSPEHKAKLAAGREAARERSRGRPAVRVEAAPLPAERPAPTSARPDVDDFEAFIDSLGDGSTLTRETRGGTETMFDVPMRGRREGWDYQYWPTHVIGQEVDPSYSVEIAQGSWFPVPASHFPQLCPIGWDRKTIDRGGQRLYMRPLRLTEEAKAEQTQRAFEQKANRLAAAQAGDSGSNFARRASLEGINADIRPLM